MGSLDSASILPPQGIYASLTELDFLGTDDEEALFIACAKGSVGDIQEKFNDPALMKEYNSFGYSPLHVAVLSERPDIEAAIDVILDNGVNVNAETKPYGDTALHLVAHRGNMGTGLLCAIKLIERGAERDNRNKSLRTPYDCALSREFLALAAILDGSLKPGEARKEIKNHSCKFYGEKLIEAVLNSDVKCMRECLNHGADTTLLNENGAGAIHYAITHSTIPPLTSIPAFIQAGCDVNLRDHEGDPVLNLVIKTEILRTSGQMAEIVLLLLKNGANTHLKDLDGKDSHILAEDRQYEDIIQLLNNNNNHQTIQREPSPQLTKSPDPNLCDEVPAVEETPPPSPVEDKSSPENQEEEDDLTEETEELEDLPHITQVNKPDKNGLQPIHRAIYIKSDRQQRERIDELAKLKANINAITTQERNTPLHLAVLHNKPNTVKYLLGRNVRTNLRNKNKKTPLDIAKEKDLSEIRSLLENQSETDKGNQGNSSSCSVM